MPKKLDLAGKRFGKLTVVEECGRNKHGKTLWKCQCDCGNIKICVGGNLIQGSGLSCGCDFREKMREQATRHGYMVAGKNRKLMYVRRGMIDRCANPKNKAYKHYGGRGINVCEEWLREPTEFYKWALANGYREGVEIDRIDVNGDYCPDNCRFITQKENKRNKRNNHRITVNGETYCMAEWAEKLGVSYDNINRRMHTKGEAQVIDYIQQKLK